MKFSNKQTPQYMIPDNLMFVWFIIANITALLFEARIYSKPVFPKYKQLLLS
jgi:hypothetical protein